MFRSVIFLFLPLCASAADLTVQWRTSLDPDCVNIQTSPNRLDWTTIATRGLVTQTTLTINSVVYLRMSKANGETCGAIDGPIDPATCRWTDNTASPGSRSGGRRSSRR